MTLNLPNIQQMHALVWNLRAEIKDKWASPSRKNSCRFLVTEAAELLDAYLRMVGGFARNNLKDLSLPLELADVVMMALTAMGPICTVHGFLDWMPDYRSPSDLGVLIDKLVFDCANALYLQRPNDLHTVLYDCAVIACKMDIDLESIMQTKLALIRAKHGPKDE